MAREYRFPVDISWDGGRRTTATVDGKAPLAIATPPVFRGNDPDLWSPEDAFVAAAGSCLVVTIAAIAEHKQLPLNRLDVRAEGVVGRRQDGRLGFVRIDQAVELETDAGYEEALRDVATQAHETCLVAVSLDLPVELDLIVRGAAPATEG